MNKTKNKIEEKNKLELFKKIFLIFLIFQPFLDCYLLYSKKVIDFVGFSPTTIKNISNRYIFSNRIYKK